MRDTIEDLPFGSRHNLRTLDLADQHAGRSEESLEFSAFGLAEFAPITRVLHPRPPASRTPRMND